MKRKKNRPPQRRKSRRSLNEGRSLPLFPKKRSQNRIPPLSMVSQRYYVALTLPLRKLGTDAPLPSLMLRAAIGRASGRGGGNREKIRARKIWSNRQIPHPTTWTWQRNKVTWRPLPRRASMMVQFHPRGRSSTLQLKRNHVLGLLFLLRRFQGRPKLLLVSRLDGCVPGVLALDVI